MENQTPQTEAIANSQAVTFVFAVGALLAGNLVNSAIVQLSASMRWENPALGGLIPQSVVGSAVVAVAVFFGLLRHRKSVVFIDSVVVELKKSAWPSREETVNNTMIVVSATVLFSVLLALYDFLWAKLAGLFLYSGV